MFALSLTLLIAVFSYVLDTGFFLREKNTGQASVETAALAAVNQCCFAAGMNDLKNIVMGVIQASYSDIIEENVTVEVGYYDAFDEYLDFSAYKDFAAESAWDFPESETWNAVFVSIIKHAQSLTGFQQDKIVRSAAVAFLPRVSMVSGNRITTGPGKVSFNNGNMYAANRLRNLNRVIIADTVQTAEGEERLPESPVIDNHIMDLETYLAKLKKKADRIYTMEDVGNDAFYSTYERSSSLYCFFDFSAPHDAHEIVYIDIPEIWQGREVHLSFMPDSCGFVYGTSDACPTRQPFGNSIRRMTIATALGVKIEIFDNSVETVMGGTVFDQLNIVSGGTVVFSTNYTRISGINFFCSSFSLHFDDDYVPCAQNFIRVISEGSITTQRNDQPLNKSYDFNLKFGPPCPPVIPASLGFLESGSNG